MGNGCWSQMATRTLDLVLPVDVSTVVGVEHVASEDAQQTERTEVHHGRDAREVVATNAAEIPHIVETPTDTNDTTTPAPPSEAGHTPCESSSVERMEVQALLLSGELLGNLSVDPARPTKELRAMFRHFLDPGCIVSSLCIGGSVLQDDIPVGSLSQGGKLEVVAVLESCAYLVEGAGADSANGHYCIQGEKMDGAPTYQNEKGLMLFRFVMSRGTKYWYISDPTGDLSKSSGDYYRVKSDAPRPPLEDWSISGCPQGSDPCPVFTRFEAEVEESETDYVPREQP